MSQEDERRAGRFYDASCVGRGFAAIVVGMDFLDGSAVLVPEQVKELARLLSDCRHNVNNHLSLVMSAMELAQLKPEAAPRMVKTVMDQSRNVTEEINRFSTEFERILKAATSRSGARG